MLFLNFFEIIKNLSYLGFFVAGLISSSTIFIPLPLYGIIVVAEKFGLNPILAAISAALGSSVGETTSYFVGMGIKETVLKKEGKKYKKWLNYFKRFGEFSILIFAALPLPFDIIGVLAGFLKYDIKKFIVFTFIGKLIKMLLIVYLGEFALQYLGW
ncbi:MAG: VTT domain-containing protein [Candidatus Aenigmatarchaeota archaeon]